MLRNYQKQTDGEVIAEFEEIESGGNDSRPELLKALDLCKKEHAILVVAKLDRLARSVSLFDALLTTKVQFVICDMPQADETTIYIIAALAQRELKLIRERTRSALAVLKSQGKILGSRNPNNAASLIGKRGHPSTPEAVEAHRRMLQARQEAKRRSISHLIPLVRELKNERSWSEIAAIINSQGYLEKSHTAEKIRRMFTPFIQ